MPPSLPVPRTASFLSMSLGVMVGTLSRRRLEGSTRDWVTRRGWFKSGRPLATEDTASSEEKYQEKKECDNSRSMTLLSSADGRAVRGPERSEAESAGIGTAFSWTVGKLLQFSIEWPVRCSGNRVSSGLVFTSRLRRKRIWNCACHPTPG